MTRIFTIGSSSSGNGYLIESGRSVLILEIGCRFGDYVTPIMSKFGLVAGCIYSHAHGDHLNPSTAREMLRRGVSIYAGEKVAEKAISDGLDAIPMKVGVKQSMGDFLVQPFEVAHNVDNYGFLIETPDGTRIVFATDMVKLPYKFKDIDCYMVECNYDDEILTDNLVKGIVQKGHPEHHHSLNGCLEFFGNNLSATTKKIILIHPSGGNLDQPKALGIVKRALGFEDVHFARKNTMFIIENDKF